ncbi:hypothetical protein [Meiothermus taiwanensis]|jgi:hypothetical protein|uniref:Uncharacterized protein n=2 Tax=Meiothermus taiwanensis TaxID=172827 RepID=A0A399E782_9DEIN|nr:hypothetical protein [Meiothermus taiwanensis]AWR87747.1 hypothetical protein Mtai_v1c25190 [Meiothermus taiwanensis WR-220]KIQ54724.1 hypothetical protein SY28_07200 [Meiothermus taiwanensis]KZK15206.1 hypothetical protein A3962_02275 [Meiothermus taiwanensis]RIH77842.1 hypothetical protein Mcate_01099 [Meiothermus taiwanensis]
MSWIVVFLALFVLIALFGLVNYWGYRRVEQAQQAWFRQMLGEGVDLETFLQSAPYEYKPLKGSKAYGIVDKRTGEEVYRARTPEEAEAWIVTNTLAEQGKLPEANPENPG